MYEISENSLNGVIDMHVHTAPDLVQRTCNDLQLTETAVRSGARAIVIKGHHCSTIARAALCNYYNRTAFEENSFVMYGGLVLNREAGGLNVRAVQTALEMGAKVIWLPTVDAENDYRKHGKSGGIRMTDDNGAPVLELRRIFSVIKDYGAVLATGHISPDEIRCVVDSARNIGVQKIVVTHPEYWVVNLSVEEQRELISDYDVIMERCLNQPLSDGRWISNAQRNAETIRLLGSDNTILSTDCGSPAVPQWESSMREYLQLLTDYGVSCKAVRHMTREVPAWLLGLSDVCK